MISYRNTFSVRLYHIVQEIIVQGLKTLLRYRWTEHTDARTKPKLNVKKSMILKTIAGKSSVSTKR